MAQNFPQCWRDLKSRTAALNLLLARLREGQRQFIGGDDGGRAGAVHSLNGLIEFILNFEEPSNEYLGVPLVALSSALTDLDDGIVSPMLETTRGLGRPSESSRRKGLRAIAVFILDLLRDTGLKQKEAAKQVADELNHCRVQPLGGGSKKFTATTVLNWRKSLSTDRGKGSAAEFYKEMKDLKDLVVVNSEVPREVVRADLLERFRFAIKSFRAADEKLQFPES